MRHLMLGLLSAAALAGIGLSARGDAYTDGTLTVDWSRQGDGFAGTFTLGGQAFPATGRASGDGIAGSFRAGGMDFPFTARLNGNTLTLTSEGKTYTLNAKAVNPLANPPSPATAATPPGDAPAGYAVVTHTDVGQALSATKADATSVHAALVAALADLGRFFDARPVVGGAYEDGRDHRSGGATFTATLKGRAVRGMISAKLGDAGADLAILYGRSDASVDDWKRLAAAPPPQGPAPAAAEAPAVKLTEYAYPDGTGSIGLAPGWKTSATSALDRIYLEGPDGQHVVIGASWFVVTPDSPSMRMRRQLEVQARQMSLPPPPALPTLVAPFCGPAEALRQLVPQVSEMNRRAGGFGIRLDQILSEKAAPARTPDGKAAVLEYLITREDHGRETHFHDLARIECSMIGEGTWSTYAIELASPVADYDRDKPLMLAMLDSNKENAEVCQRIGAQRLEAQRRAGQEANAQQQARFEAQQRAHREQLAGYEAHNQQWAADQNLKARAHDDVIEMIGGYRTVLDTQTGTRGGVDYLNVDGVVNGLNERDPGRYVQVPLRDENDPLPGR